MERGGVTVPLSGCCLSVDLRYSLLGNLPRREAEKEVRQLGGSGGGGGGGGGLLRSEEGGGGEEGGSMTCEPACCWAGG